MEYSTEQLEQINIHSLRNLAREIGVKSPTLLNKKELIDDILKIKRGEKSPHPNTKKGRPTKTDIKDENFEKELSTNSQSSTKLSVKEKKSLINSILKQIEITLNELL